MTPLLPLEEGNWFILTQPSTFTVTEVQEDGTIVAQTRAGATLTLPPHVQALIKERNLLQKVDEDYDYHAVWESVIRQAQERRQCICGETYSIQCTVHGVLAHG